MALCSFLRLAAEVINIRLYLPAKPKLLPGVKMHKSEIKENKTKKKN